jgi:hypothetical protein
MTRFQRTATVPRGVDEDLEIAQLLKATRAGGSARATAKQGNHFPVL